MEKAQHIFDRPNINITFSNVNYSVLQWRNEKSILKNVSGQFKAGQISAILGPSGAGKTTLLNILAGYKSSSATGEVTINNQPRKLQYFYKISRYIMQENSLHPDLTVDDSIMFAADFKLGYEVSQQRKQHITRNILQNLKLTHVINTKVVNLSGGERKRLTIALELINNPSVLFLDEPTSGLDEQASFQCISLLKQLAEEGRTVVCSIHSPSPKVFGLFHHVYILSEGQCVFQGQGNQILPYLEKIQLPCPIHYTPIDFFLDVASGEYGPQIDNLVSLTENGKLSYSENEEVVQTDLVGSFSELGNLNLKDLPEYDTSTWLQLKILLRRTMLQTYRDTSKLKLGCISHGCLTLAVSSMYYNLGNDATKTFSATTFLHVAVFSLVYSFMVIPLTHFPIELKRVENEYFNRWYNIPAYFFAKTLSVIPSCTIYTFIFVCITLPIVGQPFSLDRIIKFSIICAIINMIVEACNLAVASVFDNVNALFFGLALQVPQYVLSLYGYGTPFHLYPLVIQIIIRFSYFRYGLEALAETIYADRPKLHCPETEIICFLTSGEEVARAYGFGQVSYSICLLVLVVMYLLSKLLNFVMLKEKLNPSIKFCNIERFLSR